MQTFSNYAANWQYKWQGGQDEASNNDVLCGGNHRAGKGGCCMGHNFGKQRVTCTPDRMIQTVQKVWIVARKAVYIEKNFKLLYCWYTMTWKPKYKNKESGCRILLKQQPRCLSLKCKWKKLWLASSAVTADSFLQDQPSRQVVSWLISCRNRSFFLADQMSQQVVH